MNGYKCNKCEMEIKPICCGSCGKELELKTIKDKDKSVGVSECPGGCGKIKSPVCCGHDMEKQACKKHGSECGHQHS